MSSGPQGPLGKDVLIQRRQDEHSAGRCHFTDVLDQIQTISEAEPEVENCQMRKSVLDHSEPIDGVGCLTTEFPPWPITDYVSDAKP
ncbi:hypothetical protein VT03_05780 [Planctomyces sp. SH-PL14]|nr:hypothetical protein VT03_05780 [Planctomyces sp. SH-PL14]